MSAGLLYLIVAAVMALLVVNAWFPIRREPLSVVSFFLGWPAGELALQNIVVEVAIAAIFVTYGALHTWEGWAALAVSVAACAGLTGLAVVAYQSHEVVARALAEATGPSLWLPESGMPRPRSKWGRWWRLTQAVPLRGRHVSIIRNVDYWGDGIHRHRLDVVRPKQPATSRAPVMVYIHGGAWVVGDKREQGKPMMYEMVARGWVCVSVNYRLSPRATWPEHVIDCKKALAWVKEHIAEHGGDPSFVALSGGSAGGHLCALTALTAGDPTWQPSFEEVDTSVDACVPFYGVMDMTGTRPPIGRYGQGLQGMLERLVMKASYTEQPEVFAQASPTLRVHADAPPFFVLQGTNDTLVPVEVAREFVTSLRSVSNAPVAYAELPRAQHAFDILASLRCQATTLGVITFLDALRAKLAVEQSPNGNPTPKADDPRASF
jgi:acetyl esterase/lipase